jgi:hypothetical protein
VARRSATADRVGCPPGVRGPSATSEGKPGAVSSWCSSVRMSAIATSWRPGPSGCKRCKPPDAGPFARRWQRVEEDSRVSMHGSKYRRTTRSPRAHDRRVECTYALRAIGQAPDSNPTRRPPFKRKVSFKHGHGVHVMQSAWTVHEVHRPAKRENDVLLMRLLGSTRIREFIHQREAFECGRSLEDQPELMRTTPDPCGSRVRRYR